MANPRRGSGERRRSSMTAPPAILHLVFGPAEHGVTRHALELAAAENAVVLRHPAMPSTAAVVEELSLRTTPTTPVHLHVTDRLCGPTPEQAADLVVALAARYRLSITLHDLPQSSDGVENVVRRSDAYRRMAMASHRVQVSSEHERLLLADIAPEVGATVVPLPVPVRPVSARVPVDSGPTVGVLGYLYPGKGHAEVLSALATLDRPEVELVALGRPSDGHEWLVDELTRQAQGRPVRITGYLDDEELDRRIRLITVPVVAPTHVSASGSVHRWIGCGRRPVVTASRYSRELEAAMPGSLWLTEDLPSAIRSALEHPEDTWRNDADHRWDIPAAAAAQTAAIRAGLR